ncbi:MAG: hypothetical protein ABEJ03_05245 [Candidatus Nanohaloarchaea archaeon]
MNKLQAVVLAFGLLFTFSFAFAPILNYMNRLGVDLSGIMGGGGGQGGQQDDRPEMPSSTFSSSMYNLSLREKQFFARQNDIVFMSLIYTNSSQRERLEEVSSVRSNFNNRLYIDLVNNSETTEFARYGFNEFPKGVAVSPAGGAVVDNVTESEVSDVACNGFRNWNSLASYCSQ